MWKKEGGHWGRKVLGDHEPEDEELAGLTPERKTDDIGRVARNRWI